MNYDFITISGWIFGLISMVIAISQCLQKEKYRKKLKMEQNNDHSSTGYQAENMTVNNKK